MQSCCGIYPINTQKEMTNMVTQRYQSLCQLWYGALIFIYSRLTMNLWKKKISIGDICCEGRILRKPGVGPHLPWDRSSFIAAAGNRAGIFVINLWINDPERCPGLVQ